MIDAEIATGICSPRLVLNMVSKFLTRPLPSPSLGTHRRHHSARFFEIGIDLQDVFAQNLVERKAEILPRTVIVESNRAVTIDRNNNVGTTLDELLKVLNR